MCKYIYIIIIIIVLCECVCFDIFLVFGFRRPFIITVDVIIVFISLRANYSLHVLNDSSYKSHESIIML